MEDLIQNAQILFEERPLPSSPVPSAYMAETTATPSFGPFMSAEPPRSAEAQTAASTTQDFSGLVDGTPSSIRSSFSPSQSDGLVEGRLIPALAPLLSPLLGLSPSPTLHERLEAITQEPVTRDARGTQVVETESETAENDFIPPTSSSTVASWWLPLSQQHLEEPIVPQSPAESVRSSSTDFSFCSTSLVSSPGPDESPPSPTASLQSAFAAFSPSLSERSERL